MPGKTDNDYYPYADLYDKVAAHKKAIAQSLDHAVHPDHLNRAMKMIDKLQKFWESDIAPKPQQGEKNG